MPSATILFTDIVGFSLLPTPKQALLVNSMSGVVQHEIRDLLVPAGLAPEAMCLPTGDGMAISFLREASRNWEFHRVMCLAVRLLKWAMQQQDELKLQSSIKLRIGIHDGSIEFVTDVNGNANVCGDTINYTQRVMDAANENQILISERAFDEHLGGQTKSHEYRCERLTKFTFHGPFDVLAKHGRRITVFSAAGKQGRSQVTSSADDIPRTKKQALVTLTELPKELEGTDGFGPSLSQATQIGLIQLTGQNLLPKLEAPRSIQVSDKLRKFLVFMPDPSVVGHFHSGDPLPSKDEVDEWTVRWGNFLKQMREEFPKAYIKLGVFHELPFYGASFLNWEKSSGKIHVSPYVWGTGTKECPGYDHVWNTSPRPAIADAYVEGLETLDRLTKNHIE